MKLIQFAVVLAMVAAAGCDSPTPAPPEPFAGFPPGDEPVAVKPVELELRQQQQPYHGLVVAEPPSREQFEKLGEAGYTAVVNVHAEAQDWNVKDVATRQMILYTHIPITGAEDLTPENVDKFTQTLSQPMARDGKVLLFGDDPDHCGALVALKAGWSDGRTVEDALEVGRKAGLAGLEPTVKKLLEKP